NYGAVGFWKFNFFRAGDGWLFTAGRFRTERRRASQQPAPPRPSGRRRNPPHSRWRICRGSCGSFSRAAFSAERFPSVRRHWGGMELGVNECNELLDARERNVRGSLGARTVQRLPDDLAPFFRQMFDGPLGGPRLRDNRAFPERIQNPADRQNRIGAIGWRVSPLTLR